MLGANECGDGRGRYHGRHEQGRHEVILPPLQKVAVLLQERQLIARRLNLRKLEVDLSKNVAGAAGAGGCERYDFDEKAVILKQGRN